MNPDSGARTSRDRKLELLVSFHRKSLLVRDQDKFSELISMEVKELLDAERATIFMMDYETNELYAKFAIGLKEEDLKTLRFSVTLGITGYVARTGMVMNIPEAAKSPLFNPEIDRLTNFKTKSVLAVPLKDYSGRIMGVLSAFNKVGGGIFDREDEDILELIATQLSSTYEIIQLLDSLRLAGLESIYALAQTAEFRDQEDTAPHIRRVSGFAAMLAESIGLLPNVIEIIRVTSPLHDIGKVAIPDNILKKPGSFTPEEFEEMKKHTIYGYEMLKTFKSPLLKAAAKIALAHHEKYDGSGYPNKLKGDAIPLEARIVTLADSFDAMTSKRVYKTARPFQEAYDEVLRHSGGQFDPMLVDAFVKNKSRFQDAVVEWHRNDKV